MSNLSATPAPSVKENKVDIHGENLSYFDTAEGSITLLFIHGSFIDKTYWEKQIAFFAPHYRVIAPDLAGHGQSTGHRKNITITQYGMDIVRFIDTLGLKRVVLIGHSFAGAILLEVMAQKPSGIIGYVAVDYFKNAGVSLPEDMIEQIMQNMKADFAGTNEYYVRQSLVSADTPPELADRIIKAYRTMDYETGMAITESFFTFPRREAGLLKMLPSCLYLINADYLPTNEDMLKNLIGDRYELHEMKSTSHYPMAENPGVFNELLQDVLMKIHG